MIATIMHKMNAQRGKEISSFRQTNALLLFFVVSPFLHPLSQSQLHG